METTFQNRLKDIYAFHEYLVRNTEDGKRICKQALAARSIMMFAATLVFSSFAWAATGRWTLGLRALIILLVLSCLFILVESNFRPRYHYGLEAYRRSTVMSQKDIDQFLLPQTIKVSRNWIEVQNADSTHRFRMSRIERIAITTDFAYIQIGAQSCIMIPKRDFASENDLQDFGRELARLHKEYVDQSRDQSTIAA